MIYLKSLILKTTIILLIFIFTGCSKDTETINQAEHFEAIGMVITDASGAIVFRILRGETSDTLFAPLNARSEAYFVKFYDNNEQIIQPPASSDKYLAWEFANIGLASVFQHEGEEGGYEFHLDGLQEGTTTMQFFIMHNGHADYRSGVIPITVKQVTGAFGEPVSIKIVDEETDSLIATSDMLGNVTGGINILNGVTTDHMVLFFVDDEGREFQPSISEHSIQVSVENTSVASITGLSVTEPYAFKVKGNSIGNTKLTIKLLHSGVVEKTFSAINVSVN